MNEMDERQQARLFDALLDDADRWNTAPHAQARRAAEADRTVADDLALVAALRAVAPARLETEAARERVGQRLAQLMREEPGHVTTGRLHGARAWLRAVTAPPMRAARERVTPRLAITAPPATRPANKRLRRVLALGGVAFLLIVALLAGATVASGQALPESPLYSLKRAEETLQLDLAQTDGDKGEALAIIASHRLAEATAEAELRHPDEAQALLRQFDAALYQLISLTAEAQASHEADAASLIRALRTILAAEAQSSARAAARGETSFKAAIIASAEAALAHIQQLGLVLPDSPTQSGVGQNAGSGASSVGAGGSGAGGGNGGSGNGGGNHHDTSGKGTGASQGTPGPKPTHTPHAGDSQSVTPTATPAASAPSTATVAPSH